jgi:hypothetical protein
MHKQGQLPNCKHVFSLPKSQKLFHDWKKFFCLDTAWVRNFIQNARTDIMILKIHTFAEKFDENIGVFCSN